MARDYHATKYFSHGIGHIEAREGGTGRLLISFYHTAAGGRVSQRWANTVKDGRQALSALAREAR